MSLSDIDSDDGDDDDEQQGRAADWDETLEGYRQRQEPRCSTHSTLNTAITHRQGRACIDSDDDDGDGGARTAAGGARAVGGNDIDWTDIQGDDEYVLIFLLFFSFWRFMPNGEKIRGVNNIFDAMEVAAARVMFVSV